MKQFSKWVLGIGGGSIGDSGDMDITLDIPHDLCISTDNNPL